MDDEQRRAIKRELHRRSREARRLMDAELSLRHGFLLRMDELAYFIEAENREAQRRRRPR